MTTEPSIAWNVFAGELDRVMQNHGFRLGQLDDRLPIHKEAVRRLQLSLSASNTFPLLNPDDLDAVIRFLGLKGPEKLHLRAAMLATAIEAKLMDRVPPHAARDAAYLLLPVLEEALLRHYGANDETIRLDDMVSDSSFDQRFGAAIAAIERGTLALYLSDSAHARLEQENARQEAYTCFSLANEVLLQAEETARDSTWQFWFDQATIGIQRSTKH